MHLYSFVLIITTSKIITAYYNYQGKQYGQCGNSERARFEFPVIVGNVHDNTDKKMDTDTDTDTDTDIISPSGLAHSRRFKNVMYFINDKPGVNIVHAISTENAEIIGSITITDAINVDWEDVTVGICPSGLQGYCIYVQDAGSDEPGPANVLYIIKEEDNPAEHVRKKADKIIKYTFQSGTSITKSNGLFVDCKGNIFFFDSPRRGLGARLFELKDTDGTATAKGLFQIDLPSTDDGPTALSQSADCCELLIKMEDKIYYIPVVNGQFQTNNLQVLPYVPDEEEESITWDPQGDRYYVISEEEPFTLKVARRNINVPKTKFSLGTTVGSIDDSRLDNLVGLATSRNQLGVLYAVSGTTLDEILTVQIFQAQTVGGIKLDLGTRNKALDLATGPCPPFLKGSNCIYINTVARDDRLMNTVYVFQEPTNFFGVTSPILGPSNVLRFKSTGLLQSIMIGSKGEIYILDYVDEKETVTVYQLIEGSGITTAVPMANFTSPSVEEGPVAVDTSPCFSEIIVKFKDVILLYEATKGNIVKAFSGQPSFLPYLSDEDGLSVAFSGCDHYLTTTNQRKPVPLIAYPRLRQNKSRSKATYFL